MNPDRQRYRREIGRTLRLAGPVVGGQLAGVGMNFIDTVMAGNLSAEALASIAVGSSVWASVMLFTTGVLMALPPSVAQLDGAGRRDATPSVARQTSWIALALALLAFAVPLIMSPVLRLFEVEPRLVPTVLGYLRALTWGMPGYALYLVLRFYSEGLGDTRPTLYFGLAGLPLNVFANWLLMYGNLGFPELGAIGCGYATASVWTLQCVGMALFLSRRRVHRTLGLFRHLEAPRAAEIRELLHVGLPIGVTWLVEVGLFTTAALLIGSIGTAEVAGHQVAINFAALTYMVPLGISMAISVRVGNAVGRRDAAGARLAARVGIALALAVQTVWATAMALFPDAIAAIYTADPEVQRHAAGLLLLAAVFQFPDGLQVSTIGALRGYKDTRVPMILTVVAYWLVGMPLGYGLGFPAGLGARGVWIGLIAGLTVAAILLVVRFRLIARRPPPLDGSPPSA